MRPEALLAPQGPGRPAAPGPAVSEPLRAEPLPPGHPGPVPGGTEDAPARPWPADTGQRLPLLPGFREMAARRQSGQARQVIADLAAQRRSAGLSQTQIAARMGTSQSAVARLEAGDADVRVSTLERYAAAAGRRLSWQLHPGRTDPG